MRTDVQKPFFCLLVAVLTSACATAPNTRPEDLSRFETLRTELQQHSHAVVATGCVVRDEVGDDYVLRRPSETKGDAAANAASRFLSAWGFEVNRVEHPLICGSLDESSEVAEIADDAKLEKSAFSLPIERSEKIQSQPELAAAYARLFRAVEAIQSGDGNPIAGLNSANQTVTLDLDQDDVDRLQQELDSDYLWLVSELGADVSGGKSVGTAILTSVISAALTGGMYVMTSTTVDGNASAVAAVRLSDQAVVWAGMNRQGAVASDDSFDASMAWAKPVFSPLFDASRSLAYSAETAPSLSEDARHSVAVRAPNAEELARRSASRSSARGSYTIGQRVTLASDVDLAYDPSPNASRPIQLPAGAQVELARRANRPEGVWWYVRANRLGGWALESDITPQVAAAR